MQTLPLRMVAAVERPGEVSAVSAKGLAMNRFELNADYIKEADTGNIIPLSGCRTVCIDLNGTSLVQSILDTITGAANSEPGCVNIILRRVSTAYGGVPRLIADRGEIYDALAELLAERNTILLDSQNDLP